MQIIFNLDQHLNGTVSVKETTTAVPTVYSVHLVRADVNFTLQQSFPISAEDLRRFKEIREGVLTIIGYIDVEETK